MSSGIGMDMDTAGQKPHAYSNARSDHFLDRGQTSSLPQTSEISPTSRKPTPSPLQTSDTTGSAGGSPYSKPRSPKSPTTTRIIGDFQSSPRSPRSHLASNPDPPKSPGSREKELAPSNASITGDISGSEGLPFRRATASPPKAHSYSQLRNVSSPLPQNSIQGSSSPPSPRTVAPPSTTSTAAAVRREAHPMPRTSSIDSAISSISLGTMHSHRPSQDSTASSLPDISNLIQTAGSAEAVIQHLLKNKQHSVAQNTQLWKLVDKQRSLVLGLNQDLERALRDKEKYRKRLREHLDSVPPVPSTAPKAMAPQRVATSRSRTPSEASADLSIQKQNFEHGPAQIHDRPVDRAAAVPPTSKKEQASPPKNNGQGQEVTEDDWVKSKSRAMKDTKHAHKTTSSSDVGVFGPLKPSVAPIQTNGLDVQNPKGQLEDPSTTSPSGKPVVSPTSSFTAKRSQPFSAKAFNGPTLTVIESTPPSNDLERMTPPRKAPPAPLDLGQPKRDAPIQQQLGPDDHSESEYDEDMEVDELPAFERGRKKTREDDDRERKAALLKESQDRSRSMKAKSSKSRTSSGKSVSEDKSKVVPQETVPFTPSFKAFSPDPIPASGSAFLSPPTSLASVLSPSETRTGWNTTEQVVSIKPMSPGLPLSPRPNHRPMNPPTPRLPRDGAASAFSSPPLSPKTGFVGLPLSPRAPRQPIPLPQTPMSLASPRPLQIESRDDSSDLREEPNSPFESPPASPQIQARGGSMTYGSGQPQSKGVFRGLISEAYPDLLLPPNALPSILVKVVSSRLKPSRHSLVIRGSDEEPVFTLGISARSDGYRLWQVEKPIYSLQLLDQQLRQCSDISVKHPDRSLFNGHSPAKIDARRIALEDYFETLLDTQMDEKTALTLCRYLSTQVSEPSGDDQNGAATAPYSGSPVPQGPNGRPRKEGYLTKRGKNFGGWKVRYFVLDDPLLRYYETPGGSLLGTIKLQSASIGTPVKKSSQSPSRGEEGESKYRHAFLINEPKKKDLNTFIGHVLCAESDLERDAWVAALLCYVEISGADSSPRSTLAESESGSLKNSAPTKKNSLKKDLISADSPDSEVFEGLQAVPYENTQAAQAPVVQITPDPRPADSPSPTTSGSQPSIRAPSAQSKAISAPQNGAKIDDVGAWGNKPMAAPLALPKEQKKRSIWGFRDKNAVDLGANHSNDSNLSLTQQQYQEQITNVKAAFGAPLAEAVEYCKPHGVDICLPAVVYRCLEYLEEKDAASEEGIFRMSGSNTLIKNLRNRFNAEGDFDLLGNDEPYYDVHAVASLLKLYLRELPQPILTRDLHIQFIKVLEFPDRPNKVIAYNHLVHKLPTANFTLIRALAAFLITIVNNSDVNKMTIRNVGIVFSPTLNIPAPVISMFLTELEAIFGEPLDDTTAAPSLEVTSSEPLTPEDIRSPRRQMFSDIPTPSYNQNTFPNIPNQIPNSIHHTPSYDQVLHDSHNDHDTGFVPMQPSYDTPSQQGQVTLPGHEYAVARPRNLAPGGAAKARRRESSMFLM